MSYIQVKNSSKYYQMGDATIVANDGVSFEIEQGELVIILGSSGAGKSTLLNILGGMDSNDEGEVWIDGVDIAKLSSHELTNYRRDDVGFVFQFYNLVANLTAKENVNWQQKSSRMPWMPRKSWNRSDSVTESIISLLSFQAVNNNVWPLPVRLQKSLKFCFAMNQLALWTTKQVSRSYKSYKICPAHKGQR